MAWIGASTAEELAAVRTRAATLGGIAPVVRGPGGLGTTPVPARDPCRLKSAFDPMGILAPGRFWAGDETASRSHS